MKKFREYLLEEMQPFAHTEKGFVGVDNNAVRDNINLILANVTSSSYATPYHAIEMIRKALAAFHISLPATLFLDGEYGHEVFEINQFGEKSGVTDSGEVITLESSPYFIYFEYDMNDRGSFEIFSEIVNADELNEIMSEVDDELEDEEELDEEAIDECWEGYRQQGTKMKGGRRVPNCVPVNEEQYNNIIKIIAEKYAKIIDESKITHIVAKKDLSKHKKWMDSEGYDTHTKNLPKSHPKHETHVGIVSKSPVESSYHGDGHAEPIKEEKINELSTAKLKDYKAKSFNYVRGAADGETDSKKVPNRFKGMELAKKKLDTREKEIDNNIDRQMRSKRSDRFGIKEENQKAKTPQKANFNVAKNLARKAMKAQVAKKAKEKK